MNAGWADKRARRQELRRRCVERAKEHRSELLAAMRGTTPQLPALCQSIISAEASSSMCTGPNLGGSSEDALMSRLDNDEYMELMAAIEESLMQVCPLRVLGTCACVMPVASLPQELRADVAALGDEAQYEDYEAYEASCLRQNLPAPPQCRLPSALVFAALAARVRRR